MKVICIDNIEIVIREAEASDAKALTEYLNVIGGESDFLTFGSGQFDRSVEQEEEIIRDALCKQNALLLLALAGDNVVGCLNFSGGLRERTAHFGEFGTTVRKAYWGFGIGKALIEYLIEWSRNSGVIRKINLRVRPDNERGIRLYKKLGFVEEGLIVREFQLDGKFFDALIMGLMID